MYSGYVNVKYMFHKVVDIHWERSGQFIINFFQQTLLGSSVSCKPPPTPGILHPRVSRNINPQFLSFRCQTVLIIKVLVTRPTSSVSIQDADRNIQRPVKTAVRDWYTESAQRERDREGREGRAWKKRAGFVLSDKRMETCRKSPATRTQMRRSQVFLMKIRS